MAMSTVQNPGAADADLVSAALAGDRDALARIYDGYADRIHTMCAHMLGDRDEAADVCGDVFLIAFQRLGQLRDPARLRPWLYAIARHEVYRRTKRRNRIDLIEEVNEMDRLHTAASAAEDNDELDARAASAELARLVQEAAAGLDDRDRMVLELQLQGLDGDDLAAALGTSTSTSYQQVHRMRERMERSVGALLVARRGRAECAELSEVLKDWDGRFSVIWRKRIARHVDGCETCDRGRRAVPAALFGTAAAATLVATPVSVRLRVLDVAPVGTGGRGWRRDGFPPTYPARRRRIVGAFVAAALLILAGVLAASMFDDDEPVSVADISSPVTPTTGPSPSTTMAADVTTTPPTTAPGVSTTIVSTTTVPRGPTTVAPGRTPPPPAPTTALSPLPLPPNTVPPLAGPTTTTIPPATTTTVPAPTVRLTGPTAVYARTAAGSECGNEPFTATIAGGAVASVTLRWTAGAATGTVDMTRGRLRWTAVLDLGSGVRGPVTVVATAASGSGGSSTSNTVSSTAYACPIPG